MGQTKYPKWQDILFQRSAVILLFLLLALFAILRPGVFLRPLNLMNILSQNTYILVVAMGLSLIMVGGGIDFSISYQISLISAVFGVLCNMGLPPAAVWCAVILTGAACGAVNGWLVSCMRIAPYIATFVSQMVFCGISNLLYYEKVMYQVQNDYRLLLHGSFLGIQMELWITVLCVLLISVISTYTVLGKVACAIGEIKNRRNLINMNVKIVEFSIYVIASVCYAIAAVILSTKQGIASVKMGSGIELRAIIIVFLSSEPILLFRRERWSSKIRVSNIIAATYCLGVISNGVLLTYGNSSVEYFAMFLIALIMIERRQILSKN